MIDPHTQRGIVVILKCVDELTSSTTHSPGQKLRQPVLDRILYILHVK